ncbi:glutamine synthetase [Tanacetum coccineum]
MWATRYILEIAGVVVSFYLKPIPIEMALELTPTTGKREDTKSSRRLSKSWVRHKERIAHNGEGNERRLTSRHETADINTFKWVDWNGVGAHTNYNTKFMREEGGYEIIKLTSRHETADINTFKWGVANRGASIRVGRDTEKDGKGYFKDRRPAPNMDPYVVTFMIAETTIIL